MKWTKGERVIRFDYNSSLDAEHSDLRIGDLQGLSLVS